MSLSSQYLEELSRRYKKQVEELQQSFSKTIAAFEENTRQSLEHRQHLEQENEKLKLDISEVLDNFLAWKSILFYLCIFVCIQIVLFVVLLMMFIKSKIRERGYLDRRRVSSRQRRKSSTERLTRSNSTEGIVGRSTSSLNEVKKRPSEEALQIVGASYTELLINSPEETNAAKELSSAGNNKKKSKARNRKTSLPNQVYESGGGSEREKKKREPTAIDAGNSVNSNRRQKLQHSNSLIQNVSHGQEEDGNKCDEDVLVADETMLLEENDEFYLPGADLAYNEFIPNSGQEAKKEESLKSKTRRLSSPAFLKSALARRSNRKSKVKTVAVPLNDEDGISSHSNGSWDWYKLRKSPSQESGQEKTPSIEGVTVVQASNGIPVTRESLTPLSSSQETSNSHKKGGSFKKMFRKVF